MNEENIEGIRNLKEEEEDIKDIEHEHELGGHYENQYDEVKNVFSDETNPLMSQNIIVSPNVEINFNVAGKHTNKKPNKEPKVLKNKQVMLSKSRELLCSYCPNRFATRPF